MIALYRAQGGLVFSNHSANLAMVWRNYLLVPPYQRRYCCRCNASVPPGPKLPDRHLAVDSTTSSVMPRVIVHYYDCLP